MIERHSTCLWALHPFREKFERKESGDPELYELLFIKKC